MVLMVINTDRLTFIHIRHIFTSEFKGKKNERLTLTMDYTLRVAISLNSLI